MNSSSGTLHPPRLEGLAVALAEIELVFRRVEEAREGSYVNTEGGDCAAHGQGRLAVRHLVHYMAAVELAEPSPARAGRVVDVGSGVGAFAAWAAARLDAELTLVDHDPAVRSVAARAFPHATVRGDLTGLSTAELITAMEVLEHLPFSEHVPFLTGLLTRLSPGGLLVLSTPDESGYPGGWSGYAPHVGTVDYLGLCGLLRAVTTWPVRVWRLEGSVYELGAAQRWIEALGNRGRARLERWAPAATGQLTRLLTSRNTSRTPAVPVDPVRISSDPHGDGTGLLAAIRRPD